MISYPASLLLILAMGTSGHENISLNALTVLLNVHQVDLMTNVTLGCLFVSFHVMPCHVISFPGMSSHDLIVNTACHITPRRAKSFRVVF